MRAGCHAVEQPAGAALDPVERSQRQAPPLYFAGDKFRADWLEQWLQRPERIRPAGDFPSAAVRSADDGDVVDAEALGEHPALNAADAAEITRRLMQLRPYAKRIAAQAYEPDEIALRMGQMNFGKFKGCNGCHRDAPDQGGVSGPQLYGAWERLQPAFIVSFIADPVAWDPLTIMPRAGLNEAEVYKLANYLKALQEAQP